MGNFTSQLHSSFKTLSEPVSEPVSETMSETNHINTENDSISTPIPNTMSTHLKNHLKNNNSNMDEQNKKAMDVLNSKGEEEFIKHVFTDEKTNRRLTYAEMRDRYG